MSKKKVLAILGSTRQNSTNHSLIKAIADLSAESLDITVFDGIANLPQFNPDNDGESIASEVADFRQQLNNAEGILICTPEYAHGVPGTLFSAALKRTRRKYNFGEVPTCSPNLLSKFRMLIIQYDSSQKELDRRSL